MAEKMKSAEAAAPLIDNGDVKKLLSLLSKVEGDLHNTVTDAKAKLEAPAPKQEAKAARPKDREAAL